MFLPAVYAVRPYQVILRVHIIVYFNQVCVHASLFVSSVFL
jgi:hypothetical protein